MKEYWPVKEYLDQHKSLFRYSDGNIYQRVREGGSSDGDTYFESVVLKKVGHDRKVLRLIPNTDNETNGFYIDGIDLDEVNENVREIVIENRPSLIGKDNTLPGNFIRDLSMLPNLKEIRAITRDWRGKCLTNVWITGWDDREVPHVIRHENMLYTVLDEKKRTVCTRRGYGDNGAFRMRGDLILPEKIPYKGKEYTLERIGRFSFRENNGLKSVSIPPSVKVIEEGAFFYCQSLERVHLHEGLERIEFWAFNGCDELKDVKLPNSLRFLDDTAIPSLY